jgi:hypothetical protein
MQPLSPRAPGIMVSGTPAAGPRYEQDVISVGQKIDGTPFGRALLGVIGGNNANPITIVPTRDLDQAQSVPIPGDDHEFAPGFPITNARTGQVTTGLGGGNRCDVRFNPHGTFRGLATPDAALLHELLHAYRQSNGRWSPMPITRFLQNAANDPLEPLRFRDWEEWFAVVVEGVYRAETGATSVRTAHSSDLVFDFAVQSSRYRNWAGDLVPTTGEQFAIKYNFAVAAIAAQEPDIFRAMRNSNAWFNPVRDLDALSALSRF